MGDGRQVSGATAYRTAERQPPGGPSPTVADQAAFSILDSEVSESTCYRRDQSIPRLPQREGACYPGNGIATLRIQYIPIVRYCSIRCMPAKSQHSSERFDPTKAGFILLRDFEFPGPVQVYEMRNHPVVDGLANILRLNIYLSRDKDFVNIWKGLLEPVFAEGRFEIPQAKDFEEAFNEPLFRGYIATEAEGNVILRAIRPTEHSMPQELQGAPHKLRCDFVSPLHGEEGGT
jgi:hypothetical protein